MHKDDRTNHSSCYYVEDQNVVCYFNAGDKLIALATADSLWLAETFARAPPLIDFSI